MIAQVSDDMHSRFDQVDRSLNAIQSKLGETLGAEPNLKGYWPFNDHLSLTQLTRASTQVAAGDDFNVALRGNGSVAAWGVNSLGQCQVPAQLTGVRAVAAGHAHGLALRTNNNGSVVAWSWNAYNQAEVPYAALRDVATAAGRDHSLALKTDGTVLAWGSTADGASVLPTGLTDVVAFAAGGRHNLFLTAQPAVPTGGQLQFVLADVPVRVTKQLLRNVYAGLQTEMMLSEGFLHTRAIDLSGAKALIQAVLELGMSHTLQGDDVLHGFFYGTEPLADIQAASRMFQTETNRLFAIPTVRPALLDESLFRARYNAFATRLSQCLTNLEATGQPEIPRIVGHTLRLLYLLRDSYTPIPPPALEIGQGSDAIELTLYGEPYAHYTLQSRDDLNQPGWTPFATTDWPAEQRICAPLSGTPQRFYRAWLPAP
jgi:hypothetical protein